jgi:ribonuclease HI
MGVVTEYSPSSTFAELLGIMMAIILIPENKKIVINTDSRASISIITNLLKNKNTKLTNNSSLKYLLEWFRYWLKKNNKEIELKWVRGHKDNKENNYID